MTTSVDVGAYSLELGSPAGTAVSFATQPGGDPRDLARAAGRTEKDSDPRPSAAAIVEGHVEDASEVTSKVERAQALFAQISQRRLDPDFVLGEIDKLTGLVERLDRAGRYDDAVRLARALSGLLALVRRWMALFRLLRGTLRAAELASDADAKAWALHELGTLNLAAGRAADADHMLGQARDLREQLGDRRGLAVTERNLQVLCQTLRQQLRQRATTRAMERLTRRPALLALLVLALLAAGGTAGAVIRGSASEPPPPEQPGTETGGTTSSGAGSQRLTVELLGRGSGRITSKPAKLACPGPCRASFRAGERVELEATALSGSTFVGWSGDCSGNERCVVPMDRRRSVSARFDRGRRPQTLRVEIGGEGQGEVTSIPSRLSCPETCEAEFDSGRSVTLVATPAPGSTFLGWTGDCSGAGKCPIEMAGPRAVTARFAPAGKPQELRIARQGEGQGIVVSNPRGIECGDRCVAPFPFETPVTLTAQADPRSIFTGWTGDCGRAESCALTMDAPRFAVATFRRAVTLTVISSEGGTVIVRGADATNCATGCRVADGSTVTLEADPATGYYLQNWEGAPCRAPANCVVLMRGDRRITASFGQIPG